MESGTCKLCLEWGPLCRSHVVPEFFHKPLYDAKHRMSGIRVSKENGVSTQTIQKGAREPLLCPSCEQLLNDRYEQPFLRMWRDSGLIPDRDLSAGAMAVIEGIDYRVAKLLLISVLFRASVAEHQAFSAVTMREGPHEESMRMMVLAGDAGPPERYPIVGDYILGPDGRVAHHVSVPIPFRRFNRLAYVYSFGGIEWTFFLATEKNPMSQCRGIGLRPDNTAILGVREFAASQTVRGIKGR